jgi:hypothetical protein
MPPKHPIIAIAYSEETRQAFVAALEQAGAEAVAAASFYDAETLVLSGSYSGLLVDLPSIVKAKGDEKVVACSLTNFFPTLRVRAVGSVLVPMTMPGAARQDNSLNDFLAKSCSSFEPRQLRRHRRRDIIMAAQLHGPDSSDRTFTLNLSWGGFFLLHTFPERFSIGEPLDIYLPEAELLVPTSIRWLRPWGERHLSGLGLAFDRVDDQLHEALTILLKSAPDNDRDRLVA